MYPITPATSAAHYLSEIFDHVDGIVHQAEDEIAACAFAIGASYAGKCAVTITSGPGMALKQELIGLAAMGEIPLVIINVQRGGRSPAGDLRRPRRCAKDCHGGGYHRGVLLPGDRGAPNRRDLQFACRAPE